MKTISEKEPIIHVVFRKFKDSGEIIALFPKIINRCNYMVMSYMHVGQHGDADYNHVIAITRLATPKEYEDLRKELTNAIGYNLKVLKKAKIRYNN